MKHQIIGKQMLSLSLVILVLTSINGYSNTSRTFQRARAPSVPTLSTTPLSIKTNIIRPPTDLPDQEPSLHKKVSVHHPGTSFPGSGVLSGGDDSENWTYLSTGLQPAWETEGVSLLRGLLTMDNDMTGGTLIHAAEAGGGITKDSWSAVIDLPFWFELYGNPYDQFCVNKSGLLTFSLSVANKPIATEGSPELEPVLGQWAPRRGRASATMALAGSTSPSQIPAGPSDLAPGGQSKSIPDNTIAYFSGTFLHLKPENDIYMFVYGQAPRRQAWIVNAGHRKAGNLETYTAVVLEETSHRIFVVDMSTTTDAEHGVLSVGVQKDAERANYVLASPEIPVVCETTFPVDNAFYLLQPYRRQQLVTGNGYSELDVIDALMFDYLDEENIPGATVAASQDGRLIFAKGYGFANVEAGIAMRPDHRSGVGSVSKVLTTLGAMRLLELAEEEEYPFSLDDFLYGEDGLLSGPDYEANIVEGVYNGVDEESYAPGSEAFWYDAYHRIRLRHLLTHTAGFNGSGDVPGAANHFEIPYAAATYSDVHRHFLETRPLLSPPPGTPSPEGSLDKLLPFPLPTPAREYSNHGMGLVGHVIHEVSGIPYIEFMQEFVFSPLNVSVTHTAVDYAELTSQDAKRYSYYDGGLPYRVSKFDGTTRVYGDYGFKRGDLGAASGGWATSARDLVRIMCATDQLPNLPDLLSPESLDEMESVPYPELDAGQAHGWDTNSDGKFARTGKFYGGAAYMAKFPSGINVAIIINTGGSSSQVRGKVSEVEGIISSVNVPSDYDLLGGAVWVPPLSRVSR